jgi:hypothetical protein
VTVGGVHRLDMTFNYHVSVLESPLGFKIDINLAGNFDDMKFGLVKLATKTQTVRLTLHLSD